MEGFSLRDSGFLRRPPHTPGTEKGSGLEPLNKKRSVRATMPALVLENTATHLEQCSFDTCCCMIPQFAGRQVKTNVAGTHHHVFIAPRQPVRQWLTALCRTICWMISLHEEHHEAQSLTMSYKTHEHQE